MIIQLRPGDRARDSCLVSNAYGCLQVCRDYSVRIFTEALSSRESLPMAGDVNAGEDSDLTSPICDSGGS